MADEQEVLPPQERRPTVIRNLIPRLPERGRIKIGGLGETRRSKAGNDYQLPVKYDHFVITTLDRGPDGNFLMDKSLHDKLGLGDEPTEIPVRLLYDDPALILQSRYACYNGKTLWCSGDGVEAKRRSKEYDKPPMPEPFTVTCPCHRQNPEYTGKDRCKMNGNLSVLIDGAGRVGGVWTFRTTSYNSITGLDGSLKFLRAVTGGILANIPFKLCISPKQTTSPTDGKPLTIYVVTLEYAGEVFELQAEGHRIALDRATTHISIANIEEEARRLLALPLAEDAVLPGDDPDAIVNEFYSEQNGDLAGTARPTRDAPQPEPEPEPEPEVTYEITDADGEVSDVEASKLVERLCEVIGAAAKINYMTWKGVMETNAPLIKTLKDGTESEKDMAAAIREYCEANLVENPAKKKKAATPESENPAPTSEGAAPAESAADVTSTDASPGPSSTGNFWERESYTLDTPIKQNNAIDFGVLQRQLMDWAAQARDTAELTKFIADNDVNVRKLHDYNKGVAETVRQRFKELGQKLAG